MSQENLTEFFRIAMILSLSFYTITAIFSLFFRDLMFKMHKNLFNIPKEKFDLVIYCFLGCFKILVILFFVVPYLSLIFMN